MHEETHSENPLLSDLKPQPSPTDSGHNDTDPIEDQRRLKHLGPLPVDVPAPERADDDGSGF
jgi:hypothetical protein